MGKPDRAHIDKADQSYMLTHVGFRKLGLNDCSLSDICAGDRYKKIALLDLRSLSLGGLRKLDMRDFGEV
jgi:hypothetical protein